jgi:hypothetical protein
MSNVNLLNYSVLCWLGVPLTFLLGFYVSLVVKRWWEQYCKAANHHLSLHSRLFT